jgi:hypothetical protein
MVLNAGLGKVHFSSQAESGDIISVGSVLAASHVFIDGSIQTTGTFHGAAFTIVTGDISEGMPVSVPVQPPLDVEFPAATGGDVTLTAGASRTLGPDSYGRVLVTSGSTLVLTGGTYYFHDLRVLPAGTLQVTGASTVFVEQDLHLSGSVEQDLAAELFIGFAGRQATFGAPLRAVVVAPAAHVLVKADFFGQLFANVIDVGPDVQVVCAD